MTIAQNPFGLHTITTYLIAKDVLKLINFLDEVFGAKLRGDIRYRDDNTVQHAEVKIGDSIIMLGEPMSDIEPMTSGMYIYVDDCDTAYHKALSLGAISVSEPANYPHGDRYGGVKDFAGNIWWVVTHVGN